MERKDRQIRRRRVPIDSQTVIGHEHRLVPRKPIPEDKLVETVQALMDGKYFDWETEDLLVILNNPNSNPKRQIVDHVSVSLFHNEGEESQKALSLIRQEIEKFDPNIDLLRNEPRFLHFWRLYIFTSKLIALSESQASFTKKDLGHEHRKLQESLSNQTDRLAETVAGMSHDDLPQFLLFSDQVAEILLEPSSYQKTSAGNHQASYILYFMTENLREAHADTYIELYKNWGWREIKTFLEYLPKLRIGDMLTVFALALEENLSDPNQLNTDNHIEEIEFMDDRILAAIIAGNWTYKDLPQGGTELYPHFAQDVKSSRDINGTQVENRHLPGTIIKFLEKFARVVDDERFLALVQKIHQEVKSGKATAGWWLTALFALKETLDTVNNNFEILTKELDGIPDQIKNVILNQDPGKVWLTKDGRIRTTSANKNLLSAYLIHTSSAQVQQKTESPKPIATLPKQEDEALTESQSVKEIPFLGIIALPTKQSINSLIELLSSTAPPFLDEDKLLEDFVGLQSRYKHHGKTHLEAIYISHLNPEDKKIREAKHLGIEAVYVLANKFYFVLSMDLAKTKVDNQYVPMAIEGTLDKHGQLIVTEAPETFVGEKYHLFLNNLALDLASRSFFKFSKGQSTTEQEVKNSLRTIVKGWNEHRRNGFPRIAFTNGEGIVAVTLTHPLKAKENITVFASQN